MEFLMKKIYSTSKAVISGIVFGACQLLSLFPSYLILLLVDTAIPKKDISLIIVCSCLLVVTPLIISVLSILNSYLAITYSKKRGNEISLEIFKRITAQDISYFDDKNSIELESFSSKNCSNYIFFYIYDRPQIISYIVTLVIVFGISIYYSWIVAICLLAYIPLAFLPSKQFIKHSEKDISEVLNCNAALSQKRSDAYKSIEYLQGNNLLDKKSKEIKDLNDRTLRHWGKIAIIDEICSFWNSGFLASLFSGIVLIILVFTFLYPVSLQHITLGSLVSIWSYSCLYFSKFNYVVSLKHQEKKQNIENQKLLSFLSLPICNEGDNKLLLPDDIIFDCVSFSYTSEKSVLNNTSFIIKNSKWTNIIGYSGSGKSTILSLLLGFRKPNSGYIKIGDDILDNSNIKYFSEHICYVSQNPFLYTGTIRYNFSLFSDDENLIYKALTIFELKSFIDSLPNGLDSEIGEMAKLMSGGEKQRLVLAMQYTRGNFIWILDEPLVHVDKTNKALILSKLKSLSTSGHTIVLVTHDINDNAYADEIIDIAKLSN